MITSLKLKALFSGYLTQLNIIVEKIPSELFKASLANDMLSLGLNAKIAANFLLRGYCPLTGHSLPDLMTDEQSKFAVLKQIAETSKILKTLPDIEHLDNKIQVTEKAGDAEIHLGQIDFVQQYIIPNYMFHMGMVYALARSRGVSLSKGDFDGLHKYPSGFSFVTSQDSAGH